MELIHYLKQHTDYELALVLTEDRVHYDMIHELNVPIKVIKRKGLKRDPRLFKEFYKFCLLYKPDIIHTWGFMTTFYSIPAKLILKLPLISSMITVARREFKIISLSNLFFNISCYFSDAIISNSRAGLTAFNVNSPKAKVIYNGVRLERFHQDFKNDRIRALYRITTDYVVVMVATFSRFKDYDLFVNACIEINKTRNDVTFLGVGGGPEWTRINDRVIEASLKNVILTGKQSDVEQIIAASDIGLLCTYSEGISNSIIEYMALGKPVIVTDLKGGSRELVIDGETGFCIPGEAVKVAELINKLIGDTKLRETMGQRGKSRIESMFSVDRMGKEFVNLYNKYV